MPIHCIVRFDTETVKILTYKHGGAALKLATTILHSDLDAFLSGDRSDDYQLVIDSPDIQYEIINIPPANPKLIAQIAQIEFQRLHPGYPPFTAFYQPIDEVTEDGKIFKRVACCMTPDDQVSFALEPFIRHNKSVSLITPLPAALAHLLTLTPESL